MKHSITAEDVKKFSAIFNNLPELWRAALLVGTTTDGEITTYQALAYQRLAQHGYNKEQVNVFLELA